MLKLADLKLLLVSSSLLFLISLSPGNQALAQDLTSDAEHRHGETAESETFIADHETPIGELRSRAEAGDSASRFELGNRYLHGVGVEPDTFEASRWFRLAAEQGNNNAQYNLGVMALNGIGSIADFDEAMRWFTRAAENGDTTSQFTLGVIHANGRGVAQDFMLAHMWFSLAAAGGEQNAAINAVLFQEMLSDEQLAESHRRAQAWVERYNRSREP